MIERKEFWWVTSVVWGHPNPTPAEVTFKGEEAYHVLALGGDELYWAEDCILIERVALPGCAAAAALEIDQLRTALSAAVSLLKERNEEWAMEGQA